ncbi:MAG: hypothetical protein ACT4NT_03100 [Nitrososphaerota archaeon]
MWKLERDDDFFRIFDKDRNIAGYFVPDYGEIFPEEKINETIEQMHKNHDKIPGGLLTVPMVKFGVFGSKEDMDVLYLSSRLAEANTRIDAWKEFLLQNQMHHAINPSHTDPDMLSLTFPIKFSEHTPLDKNSLLEIMTPTLDLLSQKGLL